MKRSPAYKLQAQVRTYGITKDDFFRMLSEQDGRCAICRRPPPDGKILCIDHCHSTKVVRQLLCSTCNSGLGRFGDSIETLERAAVYLEKDHAAWLKQFFAAEPTGPAKTCRRCKESKPISDFKIWAHGTGQRTHGNRCQDCRDELMTPRPGRTRFTQYKLPVKRYRAILASQNNACAICLRPQEKPYVDHSHESKLVRGLLCLDDNLGIGLFGDSPELLRRAADYLRKHKPLVS